MRTLNTKVKVVRFRFTKPGQGGLLKVDEVISLVGAPLMIATTTGMPAATVLARDCHVTYLPNSIFDGD